MLTFDVLREVARRHPQQQARVDLLRGLDEEFAEVMGLAQWFMALVRKERSEPLCDWLAKAVKSTSQEMRGFAQGIARDQAAVAAAMSLPWSNGPVEGKINRLKVIKREMFGRAGFAMLRLRVLHAG